MGAAHVKLTVLGSAASYAGPGNACSGYLYETQHAKLLVDCGNGVLTQLSQVLDPYSLDAIIVTHGHPDHFGDLYVFESLYRYAPEGPWGCVPVYAPPGLFEQVAGALCEFGRAQLNQAFQSRPLVAGESIKVGDIEVMPFGVQHSMPTLGLRITAHGHTIAYTADTTAFPGLSAQLEGADLAVVDATLPEMYAGRAPHMTAREAGTVAREAGVPELALVHLWPTNDPAVTAADASETFGRAARVALPFDRYTLNGSGGRWDRAL